MFYKNFYKGLTTDEILNKIKTEGFNPIIIRDDAGYIYSPHTHPETKLLAFLKGKMTLTIDDKTYTCFPGDKVIVPGNVLHNATVGPEGCEFFWAEKLILDDNPKSSSGVSLSEMTKDLL